MFVLYCNFSTVLTKNVMIESKCSLSYQSFIHSFDPYSYYYSSNTRRIRTLLQMVYATHVLKAGPTLIKKKRNIKI